MDTPRGIRMYRLTDKGFRKAENSLGEIPEYIQEYAQAVAEWMRPLSFTQLLSAIYAEYPEMQVNSVFREAASA